MTKDKTPAEMPTPNDAQLGKNASGASSKTADGDQHTDERKPLQWRLWFRITVIVLFGLLYAWDLFEAVSNLFGKIEELARINEVRVLNGFAIIDPPWLLLISNLLLPVVVFAVALLAARKRNVGILAMVLLAGLGVVAAISLSLTTFVLQAT